MKGFNAIAIFPTGIGLAIGGDASAGPVVSLLAGCCDNLIVNPNGCNASDIYVGTPNTLYVEGSTIDRLCRGEVSLRFSRSNKILCVCNKIVPATINAVNASRWTLGAKIEIKELNTPLKMTSFINNYGLADGRIEGADEMIEQIQDMDFDQLCIHTQIDCPESVSNAYWNGDLEVNPWGKVESMLSAYVTPRIERMAFHAPIEAGFNTLYSENIVGLQQAAEIISNTYAHCIFSGAHKAPTIHPGDSFDADINYKNIHCLISPYCWGPAQQACYNLGIPVVVVKQNTTKIKRILIPEGVVFAENYLEAAGVIGAIKSGVDCKMVRLEYAD